MSYSRTKAYVLGYFRRNNKYQAWSGNRNYRLPSDVKRVDLLIKSGSIPLGAKIVHKTKLRGRETLIVSVPKDLLHLFDLHNAQLPAPRKKKPRSVTEFDMQIGTIRKALKKLAPTLSVRRGRGTAYGWIEIWGSGPFNEFTDQEKKALEKLGLNYGGNCTVISPENRKYYVEKAKEILGEK